MSQLTELLKKKNWRIWLKAALSAVISGGAAGIAGAITIPGATFRSVIWAAFVAGIAGAAMYLKKSPMPEGGDAPES